MIQIPRSYFFVPIILDFDIMIVADLTRTQGRSS